MNRPIIKIIQDQQEELRPADISQHEREMLLAKYGYGSQPKVEQPKPMTFGGDYSSNVNYGTDSDSGYTFKISVVSDMPIPKND